MAHIHEKIDFTVAIFVVDEGRVLRMRLPPPMSNAVKWYCRKALEEVRAAPALDARR